MTFHQNVHNVIICLEESIQLITTWCDGDRDIFMGRMVTPRTILTVLVGLATSTVETPRVLSTRRLYALARY